MTDDRENQGPAIAGKGARRAGGLITVGLCVLIGLHLTGDRLTPHSSQARVHAFVVPIASEVGGRIEAVHVRNNQRVSRGQKLFTLAADAFVIARQKALADIAATRREQQAQDAAIDAAAAQLAIAAEEREKARLDWSRHERIYEADPGAISLRRLELARASWAEAKARVRAAGAQLAQARAARGPRDASNDRMIAARSALERAELDLARTSILAPGEGLVTDLRLERGQVASPGAPIMTFISLKDGWVTADMTENNLGRMHPGAPADIVLDAMPGRILKGRVRSIGFGVNSGGKGQPGGLPDVQNNRDFLRQAQRFPVIIELLPGQPSVLENLREGGQADVIVYSTDNSLMNMVGRLFIKAIALTSYAY